MEDIIQLKDQFYVLATSSLADPRTRVLKQGDSFAVFDVFGNIQPIGKGTFGLFEGATRHLSYFDLRLGKARPVLLSSTIKNDNTLLTVDAMNRDDGGDEGHKVLPSTLHLFRSKFLWENTLYERIRITNFGSDSADFFLSLHFSADFTDIFEIRGVHRSKRGQFLDPVITEEAVTLGYRGLDNIDRFTHLRFSPKPIRLSDKEVVFHTTIAPKKRACLLINISYGTETLKESHSYGAATIKVARQVKADREADCEIWTSHSQFNDWLERSRSDLHMMVTKTPQGPYPYAGVPFFNTIFGRDGLITALQVLWTSPAIARGVLSYLSSTQATQMDDSVDAEPGKILHEVRVGEMVNMKEVPFRKYYGSVDSTPLYLVLAAAYFQHTEDFDFIHEIWPNLVAALEWIDKYGDLDGDGFVEYHRRSPDGLVNQGWKDSWDSVFHADGTLAEGPIALCEIQGYVFRAKHMMAQLVRVFGGENAASWALNLERQAEALRQKFEAQFWCDDIGIYALALDGKKRPCKVLSSNAGHSLFSGIAQPDRAHLVANHLLGEKMFSGWGIRTIGTSEARYNPMSYHNGSIWPHDNSLIVEGLTRYGFMTAARRASGALFDAAKFMDLHRLPELYCGFVRRQGAGPTLYPVACSPQSWASATVFLLLKALLGITVTSRPSRLLLEFPELPTGVDKIHIRNLRVGSVQVDLRLERHESDVGVTIQRKTGPVEVLVKK